ncbi:DNA-binding transcriptional regulator GbsR (MarR family) [Sinobaca qinghaiensis]|uniref:HTH-type transcriptional regulator n=1 Tax=Sinobaca qinghaiensis TaxID=342944 RepID=A0A419UX82_9BACL|nr:GbsR/MarR family transcriptional regulator [Sinobaca qinghaiensis]RKD69724.1 DNA-binding transcriptional regulator GbsR (MarR family) [Sinobaca qinghaiensis]
MTVEKEAELLSQLSETERQIGDRISDNMSTFGVSSTIGRLLGIIYMNREPMTLDDLAEATGMSKTRMSQVMREMIALNIAEKEHIKGSRKEHYNVENDYVQTFISLFTTNWREVISKNRMFAKKLQQEINEIEKANNGSYEVKAKVEELRKELSKWVAYYNWINNLVEFFESGAIFESVPVETPLENEGEDK